VVGRGEGKGAKRGPGRRSVERRGRSTNGFGSDDGEQEVVFVKPQSQIER
jgi:hypothetical protein